MKFRLLLFVLIISNPIFSQKNGIDVLHYNYSIELNDSSDVIVGKAMITYLASPVHEVYFDLANLKNGKGMNLDALSIGHGSTFSVYKSAVDPSGPFYFGDDKIHITYRPDNTGAASVNAKDTFVAVITYHGIPSDGLIISKNKFGHRTFFGDNWPERAHNWIPCVDDPADKATVEFIVTAPDHYQVISNGVMIEETNLEGHRKLTHYKEDVPLPTKVMVIGVADFAVNLAGNVDCIPVYSWVYPEEKKNGFYDYALAKKILAYFMDYIGPFPYAKLANVQSKTKFGGMENAGAIFYHENSVDGKRGEEYLYAHEIAHQWFGDMATERSFPHVWLSESFATYLTHLYAETRLGTAGLNERMINDRREVIDFVHSSPRPVVDDVTPVMQLLSPNSYQRGSWVLHMLRRQLGDTIFHKAIKTYYDQFKGKNAETSDLQAVFEKVSGKKLDVFFKQWLFTPEIPNLDIRWKYISAGNKVSITIKQLQSSLFTFPLDVLISGQKNQSYTKTLQVSKRDEEFILSVNQIPSAVKFDPSVSLLYESTVTKISK